MEKGWKRFIGIMYFLLIAALLMTLQLVIDPGCFFPEEQNQTGAVYGVVFRSLEDPFYEQLERALSDEVAMQGGRLITRSAGQDPARQARLIDEMAEAGVNGLYVCLADSDETDAALQRASDAGIRIVAIESAPTDTACIDAAVTSDNQKMGQHIAQYLFDHRSEARILLLQDLASDSATEREAGLQQELRQRGAYRIVQKVDCGMQYTLAQNAVQLAVQQGVEFDTVIACSDRCAIAAAAVLKKNGRLQQTTVIGINGEPQARELIEAGKMSATMLQQTGELAGGAVWAMQRPEEDSENRVIRVPSQIVHAGNIRYYGTEIWK